MTVEKPVKTRRKNGEASYRDRTDPKTGRIFWEGRIRIKGKQESVYGKTERSCRDQINKLIYTGLPTRRQAMTLGDWLDKWLEEVVKINKRDSTYRNYTSVVKNHIKPNLGQIKLELLDWLDIQKLINTKQDKQRTAALIKIVLTSSLRLAEKDGRIPKNPALLVTIKKNDKEKKKSSQNKGHIEEGDFGKVVLIDTAGDQLATASKIALMTGLRRGEVLGLKWTDIDLKEGILSIKRAAIRNPGGKTITAAPKTEESIRTIPLIPEAIEIFNLHQEEQKEIMRAKKEAGIPHKKSTYIFTNRDGELFHPDSMRNGVKRLLEKAGLKTVRVHDLRHSHASILFEKDVDSKIIQTLLGHKDIKTTLNTYVKTSDTHKQKEVLKLSELISSTKPK